MAIQEYLSLVTSEHANKPNFIAWLTAILSMVNDTNTCAASITGAFDLGSAVGVQLDAIGAVVGVSRTVDFQPSAGVSPVLDDPTYLIAIKGRIAMNQWDGTITGIQEIWQSLFPNIYLILKDNQDMSMNALVIGLTSSIQQDLVTNGYIVPKPEGVSINYTYPTTLLFAYDLENTVFSGYDQGYWVQYV